MRGPRAAAGAGHAPSQCAGMRVPRTPAGRGCCCDGAGSSGRRRDGTGGVSHTRRPHSWIHPIPASPLDCCCPAGGSGGGCRDELLRAPPSPPPSPPPWPPPSSPLHLQVQQARGWGRVRRGGGDWWGEQASGPASQHVGSNNSRAGQIEGVPAHTHDTQYIAVTAPPGWHWRPSLPPLVSPAPAPAPLRPALAS